MDKDRQGYGSVGVTEVFAAADAFGSATNLTFRGGADTAVIGLKFAGTETQQGSEPTSCGSETMTGGTAWLTFTPLTSGTWMIESKAPEPTPLAVYSGTSLGSLGLLNCTNIVLPDDLGHLAPLVHLEAGTEYMIQVFDQAGLLTTDAVIIRAETAPTRMLADEVSANGGESASVIIYNDAPAIAYRNDTTDDLIFAMQNPDGSWTVELVDANGGGGSGSVGWNPSLALVGGLPAISYYDASARELRYASRSTSGTWTDELVDADGSGTSTDVGWYSSLAVVGGNPAIAYEDDTNAQVRYAEKSAGSWSDLLIEATDDFSVSASSSPSLRVVGGDPAIAFIDYSATTMVRYAERSGGAWSTSMVHDSGHVDFDMRSSMAVGADGLARIAATLPSGRHVLLTQSGVSWTVDVVDADNKQAELDFSGASPQLLLGPGDVPTIVWFDNNLAFAVGITTKDGGDWITQGAFPYTDAPTTTGWPGRPEVNATAIGATWLADGRLGVSFGTDDGRQWFASDSLQVDLGSTNVVNAAIDFSIDASATADGWGNLLTAIWGPTPDGYAVDFTSTYVGTIRCVGPSDDQLTLTITDDDGFSHSYGYTISNAVCPTGADPFIDSDGTFHDDINCIYNIGVTTGLTADTYGPAGSVTRQQMALFMARLYASITGAEASIVATPFTDVTAGTPVGDAISRIYGLGITLGDTATTYNPAGNVTHRQMALFMARLYDVIRPELAPVAATPFTDVNFTGEAADAIGKIFGLEITLGATATTYEPTGFVTRGQMAAFLARLFQAD